MEAEKEYILLVDDETSITGALRRDLIDWANENKLEILIENSARNALILLKEKGNNIIIIISDLKMPEIKGSDFLVEVKKDYPHIVSLLLTGFSETNEIVKAVSADIFSYMLKPWELEPLLAEVQKAYVHSKVLKQNAQYIKMVSEELKWAGEMQKAILKPNLPHSEGVEFRVSYRPVTGLYCGGDYYDVIFLGTGRYLLLIGDVAGHGIKAAFVTGILKAVIFSEYVHGILGKEFSPGNFLSWLNERMNFEFRGSSNMLISFFAAVIDVNSKTLKYANAGHNHPFIIRNNEPSELLVSGTVIGAVKSIVYSETTVNLLQDDIILLYTDGLIEINCQKGNEPVKIKDLLKAINPNIDYHKKLIEGALLLSKTNTFTDDLTIVTARIQ